MISLQQNSSFIRIQFNMSSTTNQLLHILLWRIFYGDMTESWRRALSASVGIPHFNWTPTIRRGAFQYRYSNPKQFKFDTEDLKKENMSSVCLWRICLMHSPDWDWFSLDCLCNHALLMMTLRMSLFWICSLPIDWDSILG